MIFTKKETQIGNKTKVQNGRVCVLSAAPHVIYNEVIQWK